MKLTKTFFEDIRGLIASTRATVARGVDLVQVHTNFEIGRRIVEQEQKGKGRAAYGQEVIRALAERLTEEFGRGYSVSTLKAIRQFYLQNQDRISQSTIGQLKPARKSQSMIGQSQNAPSADDSIFQTLTGKSQTTSGELAADQQMQTYVNTFDREVKLPEENATVGIILCKMKSKALVEITLPKAANIHAHEYRLYLPGKEELQRKLNEWAREVEG